MKIYRGMPTQSQVTRMVMIIVFALSVPVAETHVVFSSDQGSSHCESIYRRYSEDHILCRQRPITCRAVDSGIEDADKRIILATHNRFRSQIAMGYCCSWLPRASNMLEMEWDDDLARVAQAYAELCTNQPTCPSCMKIGKFPTVGRTHYVMHTDSEDDSPDWEGCIGNMFNESLRVPIAGSSTPLRTIHGAESFTQLAWATTWKVGCGYVKYRSHNFRSEMRYTCAYGPGGNIRGEDVYKVGPACSNCPMGTCCGTACQRRYTTHSYNGLCKVIDDGPSVPVDDDELLSVCLFNKATTRDCTFRSEPTDGWTTTTSYATGYAESVLESGQSAEFTFEQPFQPSNGRLCVEVDYNKGPNVAGMPDRGLFNLLVTPVGSPDRQRTIKLSGGATNVMHMRVTLTYNVAVQETSSTCGCHRRGIPFLGPSRRLQIGFSFAVPRGSSAQYVNIHKVAVYDKACSD
ncbi:CRISP/Allergen/PR-1 isoform X6 [Dermacentor silvarum]|uniref:CRISP/Allergen/PR-1 isoform X6 n=1 Tax=Dermacentor silvarum TaxID=543639 RepID=UPI002100FA0C|nr:CRISP/Allergen/PR-1 isoform X6 [Dermacentor silvarum]